MLLVCRRLLGVKAIVCLLCVLLSKSAFAQASHYFAEGEEGPGIVAYEPADRSVARPVTIMLHGMCGEPERTCNYLASTITRDSWLLCPRARRRCDGGGSTWGTSFASDIETGVERVKAAFPGELDESPGRTLIGFSLGAFRALDLAQAAHGQYPRVILIGAKIFPDARRLREAGVRRLLLAAGEYDMMRGHMADRSRALIRNGFPAAFQSYGPVGHAFPQDFPELLSRGLRWTDGDDAALSRL